MGIGDGLVAGHPADAVGLPQREGEAGTGGRQRFETEAGQQLGRTRIPRVGQDEATGFVM